MFCALETVEGNFICFLSLVYAANTGIERRDLWRELYKHKSITNGQPWVIFGDFNVTLDPDEHSAGSYSMSLDMSEFRECVNQVEIEDLCSSG